jgi:hypothetical protein
MPFAVGIPWPVSKGTEMRQPVRRTVPAWKIMSMVRMPPCGMSGMAPPVTIAKALTGSSHPVPTRFYGVSSARTSAPSGHGSAQSEHAADEALDNNPNYHVPGHVLLAQALCFAKRDDESYYPIGRQDDKLRYNQYKELAEAEPNVIFAGRLGTYRYLDMHQAIGTALSLYEKKVAPRLTGKNVKSDAGAYALMES